MIGHEEKRLLDVQDAGRAQKPIEAPGGRLLDRPILVTGDEIRVDAAAGRHLDLRAAEEDLPEELDQQRRGAEIGSRETRAGHGGLRRSLPLRSNFHDCSPGPNLERGQGLLVDPLRFEILGEPSREGLTLPGSAEREKETAELESDESKVVLHIKIGELVH